MSIATRITGQGQVTRTIALDQGTAVDSHSLGIEYQWPDGTGVSKADEVWSDERTLTVVGSPETLDLTALPQLDADGNTLRTVSFDKIKYIAIKNTTTSGTLTVGAPAANGWIGGAWNALGDDSTIGFGGSMEWSDPTGVAVVAATGDLIDLTAAVATQTYQILIIGEAT